MSRWLDLIGVCAALAVSVSYAVMTLGPTALRAWLWRELGALIARLPGALRSTRLEARIAARSARLQAACGGCAGCGSQTSGAPAGGSELQGNEVRVPLDRIGVRPPRAGATRR
jgi:hypothetical protein